MSEELQKTESEDVFEKLSALSGNRVKYLEDGSTQITLKDGRIVVILAGKWKHGQDAMRLSNNDNNSYQDALMSILVTIDGKKIVMEDLGELPLADGMLLNSEFVKLNFS